MQKIIKFYSRELVTSAFRWVLAMIPLYFFLKEGRRMFEGYGSFLRMVGPLTEAM
jgi:hypothetical protein